MKIETLLHEEIRYELEQLGKIEIGTELHESVVNGLTKLMDRAIEIERIDTENSEKAKSRIADTNFKLSQMEDERKDRLIKNYIAIAGILIPAAITIWGTFKSFEFEKDGTITTIMGRGFVNKLLPKK